MEAKILTAEDVECARNTKLTEMADSPDDLCLQFSRHSVPMNASAQAVSHGPAGRGRPILAFYGGLLAGTFDITYACVFWALKAGVVPERIFQSVAAGLLGRASFSGGLRTAALGLFVHYFIATTMSLVYYLVSVRWTILYRQPWLYGPAYGLLLYGVMNYVVLPLSRALPGSKNPLWIGLSVAVHMLLIGTPIALFARKARCIAGRSAAR